MFIRVSILRTLVSTIMVLIIQYLPHVEGLPYHPNKVVQDLKEP